MEKKNRNPHNYFLEYIIRLFLIAQLKNRFSQSFYRQPKTVFWSSEIVVGYAYLSHVWSFLMRRHPPSFLFRNLTINEQEA